MFVRLHLPMKMTLKSVPVGICSGVLVGFILASLPTAIHWYNNPGGVFRSDSGTNWGIVFETWLSWFWPVSLLAIPVALLVHAWVSNRRVACNETSSEAQETKS